MRSCSEVAVAKEVAQLLVEGPPGAGHGAQHAPRRPAERVEVGERGDDDMGGEAGEEGGDPSAVGRDLVAVASGEALDDPLEAQPSQVVGGLGARVALS